ncbi:MAG: hypothetical protein QOF17_300 [Solirubrobacteraceae bacterium]|nr:hypothetical protein [Solirubrobacteraceae bacterium]
MRERDPLGHFEQGESGGFPRSSPSSERFGATAGGYLSDAGAGARELAITLRHAAAVEELPPHHVRWPAAADQLGFDGPCCSGAVGTRSHSVMWRRSTRKAVCARAPVPVPQLPGPGRSVRRNVART